MDKSIDELNKGIDDMAKQNLQALYDLCEKHSNDLQQLFDYMLDDMFKTYDNLITQRNECIDKYIKLISIVLQDEKDISKPIQSLIEKKHEDAKKFENEIAPMKKFHDLIFADDDPTDKESDELVEMLMNV